MKLAWYWKVGIALLVVAFVYLVWPTAWRYEHHAGLLVRIDRLRGTTDVLTGDGWNEWRPPPPDPIEEAIRRRSLRNRAAKALTGKRTTGTSEEERERARQRLRELEGSR